MEKNSLHAFSFSYQIMSKPRPDHMNLAIAAAASLVMDSMNRAANNPKDTARSLSLDIVAAFGIRWNRDISQSLTRDAVNQVMRKLRNSPLHRLRYDKLAGMFKTAFCHPYSRIPEWDERKQLADAFMLGRRFPQEDIAHAITFLTARSVPDPGALALLDAGSIETMDVDSPNAGSSEHSGGFPAQRWRLLRQTNTRPFQKQAYRPKCSRKPPNAACGHWVGIPHPYPSLGNGLMRRHPLRRWDNRKRAACGNGRNQPLIGPIDPSRIIRNGIY